MKARFDRRPGTILAVWLLLAAAVHPPNISGPNRLDVKAHKWNLDLSGPAIRRSGNHRLPLGIPQDIRLSGLPEHRVVLRAEQVRNKVEIRRAVGRLDEEFDTIVPPDRAVVSVLSRPDPAHLTFTAVKTHIKGAIRVAHVDHSRLRRALPSCADQIRDSSRVLPFVRREFPINHRSGHDLRDGDERLDSRGRICSPAETDGQR